MFGLILRISRHCLPDEEIRKYRVTQVISKGTTLFPQILHVVRPFSGGATLLTGLNMPAWQHCLSNGFFTGNFFPFLTDL